MIYVMRLLLGLVLIGAISVLTFKSVTGTSFARFEFARSESADLDLREAALKQRLSEVSTKVEPDIRLPKDMIWVAPPGSSIELEMQKAILDAASSAGMKLVSFGAADGPKGDEHPTAGYEVEGVGGHVELARFLAGIENTDPRLAVSQLWVRQVAPDQGQVTAPVDLRLTVWAYRGEAQ